MSADVSVLIPTRNRRQRLMATLETALGQVGVELEVVVVDDGSTDGTAEQIRSRDSRLRLLRNERSVGQARARNQAIEAAEGEWLAFLDDDDLWAPHKLREQLESARVADAGFIYATALVVDDELRIMEVHEAPKPAELLCALIRGNAVPAGASNVMARSDLVRATGGFDERLSLLTDWDLWLRLAGETRVAACDEPLLAYVHHGLNYILEGGPDKCREMEYLAAKHAALERRCGIGFDLLGLVHWIAGGQAAAGQRLRAAGTHLHGARRYRNLGHLTSAARVLVLPTSGGDARPPRGDFVEPPEWLVALRERAS